MWRFIKEIPKAIRQNWNAGSSSVRPAPTICQEDENDAYSHKATKDQPQLWGAHYVQRDPEWWKDDHSWQKRSRDNHRTQHHRRWTATEPSHNALEAIGWGSIIVLGLHLSKFYHLKSVKDYKKDLDSQQSGLISLYDSLTCATISQSIGCYVRETDSSSAERLSCLGSSSGDCNEQDEIFLKDVKTTEKEEIFKFDTESLDQDGLSSLLMGPSSDLQDEQLHKGQESNYCKSRTDDQTIGQWKDSPVLSDLEKAAMEWQSLSERVKAQIFNQRGLKRMRQQSTREAFKLWQEASSYGNQEAQFNLGLCYELGKGTKKDLKKAAEQYRLAGNSGYKVAQYNLAMLLLMEAGDLDSDISIIMSLLETAAEGGLAAAQRELGVLYTESTHKDMVQAAQLFNMAATQKDTKGQYYMGICYENGWGVVQDVEKAMQMYSAAAADGHGGALHNLAAFHEHGLGGQEANKKVALQLYKKAVKAGNSSSQRSVQQIEAQLEEANLHKELERLRLQFDGGTRDHQSPARSKSSPVLSHASSLASFSVYIRQNIVDFGITEFDTTASSSLLDFIHVNREIALKHVQSADRPFSSVSTGTPVSILDQNPLEGGKGASFFLGDCDEYGDEDNKCSPEMKNETLEHYTIPMLKLSGTFSSIAVGGDH